MNHFAKSPLVFACLIFVASCEKNEQEVLNPIPDSPATVSKSGARVPSSVVNSQSTPKERAGKNAWLGKVLNAEDDALFGQWAQDLSRNEGEQQYRQRQLAHLRRAEVINWNISDQDLEPVKAGGEPKEVDFPFFENKSLTVVATEIRRFGQESVNLEGHLAVDPATKVYLSLSNQAPTATIEGPDTLYHYEAFEGVAILREDEPGSQYDDFDCNCETHQAAQGN